MAHQALENFQQIADVLTEDVKQAEQLYQASPSEFSRRVLIKTLFTYLEGHLYAFKQTVLAFEYILNPFGNLIPRASGSYIVLFSDEEKAMLQEFTYDMGSGGKARQRDYFPKLEENVKFLVQVFHKVVRLESKILFDCEGWNCLLDAQRIRNLIAHPKGHADLTVSDDDIKVVQRGVAWYEETISEMLRRLEKDSIYAPQFKKK